MKVISFFVGLVLLSVVIYIGYYTIHHTGFVIWFGVATAVITPFAIEALFYPFRSSDKTMLKALAKVPQIQELEELAKTSESKLADLNKQKEALENLIAFESKRRTLIVERDIYLLQGKTALEGLERVSMQLKQLKVEEEQFPEEIKPLLEFMQTKESADLEITIGNRSFLLKRQHFAVSIYGSFLFEMLRFFHALFEKIEGREDKVKDASQTGDKFKKSA